MDTKAIESDKEITFWNSVFQMFWGIQKDEEGKLYSTVYKWECGGIRDSVLQNIELCLLLFGECFICDILKWLTLDFYKTFEHLNIHKLTMDDWLSLGKSFKLTYEDWISK